MDLKEYTKIDDSVMEYINEKYSQPTCDYIPKTYRFHIPNAIIYADEIRVEGFVLHLKLKNKFVASIILRKKEQPIKFE